jgi:4-hydroxybenzoate polyprenyltransferase
MSYNELYFIRYFRFFRILDWIHFLGLTVLGYAYASRITFFSNAFWIGIIVSSLYLAHGYSLNECFDNRVDNNVEIYGKYFIPFKKAILLSYLVFIANLIFTLVYSFQMMLLVIFGGLIGLLYSAYPFRLKEVPFLGIICNSLCFTPLFIIGYVLIKTLDLNAFLMALFIFVLLLPIDLIHQLNDAEEDGRRGFRTTAVVCGVKGTIGLIIISLFFLNFWLLVISRYMEISSLFFLLTLFFSLLVVIYLIKKFLKYGDDIGKYKIKLELRNLFIAYGIGLLITIAHTIGSR